MATEVIDLCSSGLCMTEATATIVGANGARFHHCDEHIAAFREKAKAAGLVEGREFKVVQGAGGPRPRKG